MKSIFFILLALFHVLPNLLDAGNCLSGTAMSWGAYCQSLGENECRDKVVIPCKLSGSGQCVIKRSIGTVTINDNRENEDTWKASCLRRQNERCTNSRFTPCVWQVNQCRFYDRMFAFSTQRES
ncbi:hypothetical protein niasHS_002960 [Heterodera schachtii]|uniref:Uncharacterized protein n=1 Tax=Heterodera schachtii TaxID=97005 RepID=A0ABD2K9Z8_HETSC